MSESGGSSGSKFAPVAGGGSTSSPKGGKVLIGSMDGGPFVEAQYNPKELGVDQKVPSTKARKKLSK